MIVVVVIALSTATYAWFSSATTSTASTTITTTATSGWSLSQGSINDSKAVTWSSSATTIDLKDQGLTAGLFSPNEELTNKPSTNAATSVTVDSASDNFYACNVSGDDAYVTTASSAKKPTVIRVVNNNENASKCIVSVLVVLNEDNANTRYAAAAMTFYFASATTTYTLGYTYCDASGKTAVDVTDITDKTKATEVAAAKVDQTGKKTVASANVSGTKPAYDSATAAGTTTGFKTNKTGSAISVNDAITINEGQTYLLYTFETDTIAIANGINFVNYTWMDGWVANDAAGAATVSTYYVFGGEIATKLSSCSDATAL